MRALRNVIYGAASGAAGTTALNAVTYLDMAVRARPPSESPQEVFDILADQSGHPVPGDGEDKQNRLEGLGPLAGIATGVSVGVLTGICRPMLSKLPAPLAGALVGLTAMALTDGPLVSLGLTDPKKWSTTDWLSDMAPHLTYGLVTYATLTATPE